MWSMRKALPIISSMSTSVKKHSLHSALLWLDKYSTEQIYDIKCVTLSWRLNLSHNQSSNIWFCKLLSSRNSLEGFCFLNKYTREGFGLLALISDLLSSVSDLWSSLALELPQIYCRGLWAHTLLNEFWWNLFKSLSSNQPKTIVSVFLSLAVDIIRSISLF